MSAESYENEVTPVRKKHFTNLKIYPWIVISLCASLLFYKYVLTVSPSIMVHELMKHFDISALALGNLAATFFYAYTIGQIFSGILIDKYGARFLTGFAILICVAGAWLFSISDSLNTALFARSLMGLGCSFCTVAYMKMAAVWFKPNQLAFVNGLLATAVMLGALFGQVPLAWLLEQTNWQFTLFLCSILGLVLAILFLLLARDAPKTPLSDTIQRQAPSLKQGLSFQEIKSALKNKQNWLLTAYSGLAFAPLSVLGGLWGNPFIQEAYGLSRTEAAQIISFMFIGLGVGSPVFGLISDKMGKRLTVMKWGVIASFALILIIIYHQTLPVWMLGTLFFLFGASVGVFMLGFTMGTESNKLALAATVIALINTGDSILESLSEPLLGTLLDYTWNGTFLNGVRHFSAADYRYAFIPLPIYYMFAFLTLAFIKEPIKACRNTSEM